MTRRRLHLAGFAAFSALMSSACSSDPAFWDAMATGLTEVADEMAWQNDNCYQGAIPGGERYGPQRQYCPGDYGYVEPVALPPSYYRRNLRDAYGRDGGHHGHHGRGDRARDRRD